MLASSIPGRGAARAKELLPGAENILKFVEFLVGCRHRRTSRRRPRNLRRAAAAAAPSRHHERAGERERKRATGVNEEEKKVLKAGPVGYKFALGGACRPGGCCWFGLMQAAVLAQTLGPVWWEAGEKVAGATRGIAALPSSMPPSSTAAAGDLFHAT